MRRDGFLYTALGLFLLNLIVLATLIPLGLDATERQSTRVNVDELFYFIKSVQDDVSRAVDISSRRAMVAVTNLVVNSGDPVADADSYVAEAFLNGTIDGNESDLMADTSFRDWIDKMEQQADDERYLINMSVDMDDLDVRMDAGFVMAFDFRYNLSVSDPRIGTSFEREDEVFNGTGTIDGVDDPLIVMETAGKRFVQYQRCGPADHAEIVMTGTESEYSYMDKGSERTWTSGDAEVFNGSDAGSISSPSEKILVTDDLCEYDPSTLNDFAGVVSEQTTDGQDVCGSGGEINAYIGGIDDHTAVSDGQRLVMNEEDVWVNRIPERIESRCFVQDPDGPSFLDRLEGRMTGSGNGLSSFLNVPNLPSEVQEANRSAVDHVYFDDSTDYGPVWRIKGVSEDEEWFRLDDDHVQQWNLDDLAYD